MEPGEQEPAIPAAERSGGKLALSFFKGPFVAEQGEELTIGIERQWRQMVDGEESSVVGIVAGLEATTHNRPPEPDPDRQLGRIVEIGGDEDWFADGDLQPGFFEHFPGRCLPDVLAIVNVSGGNSPQPGLGSGGTATDQKDPSGPVLNHRCHAHSGIPEMDKTA